MSFGLSNICHSQIFQWFSKKLSVYQERIEFHEITQGDNESTRDYFVRTKNKAIDCKFGGILHDVSGLKDGKMLDRLCGEDHTVTLDSLVEIEKPTSAVLFSW